MVHQTPIFPRKFEEKEDGGAPNEEEFSRKDNDGGAFNISEFVSILPTLYSPGGEGAERALAPPPPSCNLAFRVSEKRTEREIDSLVLSAPSDLKT